VIRQLKLVGAPAAAWEIDLDADLLGKITPNRCLYATVPPGEHNLRVIHQDDGYTFRTEADKNDYFPVKVSLAGRVDQPRRSGQLVVDLSKRLTRNALGMVSRIISMICAGSLPACGLRQT
jgi:hypothetical protein